LAIVIPSFHPGGTERQMIELVRRLDRRRWDVHLCCVHPRGRWFQRAAEAASSVSVFPIRGFWRPNVLIHMRNFAAWCRRTGIQVVQTSELYSNIFALPASAWAGVDVRIGSRREICAGKSRGHIAMQRAAYACADRIVANADAVAERLRREGVPAHRIVVVRNGLDTTPFQERSTGSSGHRIVMVANLRPEKGHDTLIDAAPAILARFPYARFQLVGDGTERDRLERYAQSRNVAGAFTFVGHSDDVMAHLRRADLFVLPSRSEAFPNGVLEAMAAGLPVVASAVGGIPEVVHHNETGLLVAPGRADALANAVCRVFSDRALGERLAAAGRARVESRYSFERMVRALEDLYMAELSRVRARPGRLSWRIGV
jgi:glycosyltransferase involved in cell wall biosynthesis